MEPIFTIPYSEYEAALRLGDCLSKDQSVFIPTKPQQKYIDFLVHDVRSHRTLRIQVKTSRPYINRKADAKVSGEYRYTFWFTKFDYKPGRADVYLFVGLYPEFRLGRSVRERKPFWKSVVMAFEDRQMAKFLRATKDRFFYISFNDPTRVYCTRGLPSESNLSRFLLEKRVGAILKMLR